MALSGILEKAIAQKSDASASASASVDDLDEVACVALLELRGMSSTKARISYRLDHFCHDN